MAQATIVRIAIASTVLLAAAACGSGDEDGGGDTGSGTTTKKQIKVYGTDGNMGNALGDNFTDQGALAGMKGTTPLTKLAGDFTTRLTSIDPKLKDYNYAGESYDAVVITALASEYAKTNKGTTVATYINGVTTAGEKCKDFKTCVALVKAGKDIDYDGITGPLEFTDPGEPAVASFAILEFGQDNKLDDAKTQYVLAGDAANATKKAPPAPPARSAAPTGGAFTIGTLLPLTGSLAFLGPSQIAGTKLAVRDVNAAGGVNGKPVALVEGDSGDASTDIASQTVDRLLQRGANMILGAASSGVSLKVIDKIAGAGVIEFSPANTSDKFTTYNDKGLYFRTAPADTLQARALADQLVKDGVQSVGILALNDPYGTGLADNIQKNLTEAGVAGDKVTKKIYDPKASEFTAEVDAMKTANPDAILVIGFDESATIIKTMNEQGIGPKSS